MEDDFYGQQHRLFQQHFDTVKLADAVHGNIVSHEIIEEHRNFIESRDMFFLTTIDHRGYPTCSYKGGHAGFIKVLDQNTLAYPSYDGNGMFLSMGNIRLNDKVGMLLMDFQIPHRIRIHGSASIDCDDPLLAHFAGAELVVRLNVQDIFINCARYIHRYQKLADSRYVPQQGKETPLPQWKRIDGLQESLPPRDQHIAEALGGTITADEYEHMVRQGQT